VSLADLESVTELNDSGDEVAGVGKVLHLNDFKSSHIDANAPPCHYEPRREARFLCRNCSA